MRRTRAAFSTKDVRRLVVLLCCALLFAAFLAFRAYSAVAGQRAVAARELHDEVEFAAFSLASHAGRDVYWGLVDLFTPVVPHDEVRRGRPDVPLRAVVDDVCEYEFTCIIQDSVRLWFRVDLRTGTAEYLRPRTSAPGAGDLRTVDSVRARLRTAPPKPAIPFVQIFDLRPDGLVAIVAAVVADGAGPAAAYGLAMPARTYGAAMTFRSIGGRRPLLPASLHARQPSDSLYSLRLTDAAGRPLGGDLTPWDGADSRVSSFRARMPLDSARELVAEVGLRPAYVAQRRGMAAPSFGLATIVVAFMLNAVVIAMLALQLRGVVADTGRRLAFTANVSHELRTPLTQILLYGESLRDGSLGVERERRQASEVIVREAHRLLVLVENVLRFSRAEHRREPPAVMAAAPLLLAPEIAATAEAFAPLAATRRMRIATDVGAALAALAEPTALRQLVSNLLDNAVKYGAPGQTIAIGARHEGDAVRFWVDDEGPGIPAVERERVWQPFVRLEDRAGTVATGTGLGLSVVRQLAGAMGGRAWVEGRPGGGARFVVALAAADAPVAAAAEEARWRAS